MDDLRSSTSRRASRRSPTGQCPDLFRASQHPNANGYRIMAAIVWNGLREAGLAPPAAADPTPASMRQRAISSDFGYVP
jgi:hypothetical protein